jgi:predicted membrane protein DUF2231
MSAFGVIEDENCSARRQFRPSHRRSGGGLCDANSTRAVPLGLVLSLVVVRILLFTGWKGGELVFRHRVAVYDGLAY